MTTTVRRNFQLTGTRKAALAATIAALMAVTMLAVPAAADHNATTKVTTVPAGSDVGKSQVSFLPSEGSFAASGECGFSFTKLDTPGGTASKTINASGGTITFNITHIGNFQRIPHYAVSVTDTVSDLTAGLHSVFLGRGSNHNKYAFNPPVISASNLTAHNNQSVSHIFFCYELRPEFDGQITCGDTVTIAEEEHDEVLGLVTMQALNLGSGWDADCSQLKNYNDDVTASSLLFAPVLENSLARYTMILTIEDQPITTDGDGQITSLVMEYNDGFGGGDMPLQPCIGQPDFDDATFFEQVDTGLLPEDEFACYFDVSLTPTGENLGDEEWSIYFEDDPNFSFR